MRKAQQTLPNVDRHGAFYAIEDVVPSILAYGSFQYPGEPIPTRDEELIAFVALGSQTMQSLLAALFRHCADIYAIRDHLKAQLECEQYQECHHVLLLLYAACREPVPASMVSIACREEMQIPFFQGVMQALDDWLQVQDEL